MLKLPPEPDVHHLEQYRRGVLCKLADVLRQQGAFALASKKYTQGNDKNKAMKCLLKGGDTKVRVFERVYTITDSEMHCL
jgi:intraflagellar transport protein 140